MPTDNTPKNDIPCTEAPASWNTRYITLDGFECQLTLRADTGQDVLEKAQGAISFLLKSGCTPSFNGNFRHAANPEPAQHTPNPNGNNGNGHDRGWCPIHDCEMRRWEKDGRVWFSHKVGDDWCSGKVKTR